MKYFREFNVSLRKKKCNLKTCIFFGLNFDKSCGWINILINLCSFPSWCPNMSKPTHPPAFRSPTSEQILVTDLSIKPFHLLPPSEFGINSFESWIPTQGRLFKWVDSFWPAPSHRRQWAPIWSWSMHTETSRNVKGRRGGLLVSTPLTSFPKLVWLCLGFSFLAGPDRLAWALNQYQYQYQYHNSVGIS